MANLDKEVIYSTGFAINKEGYIVENSALPVRNPHGTVIAMIISHICSDIELISINILDENLSADGRVLAYALSQVFDYKPDIIHMSLGTLKKRYIGPLKRIVKEAKKLNVLLVAAAEYSGKISYPAYLNGVIGVKGDKLKENIEYYYKDGFFYAPIRVDKINNIKKISNTENLKGTSISAAYISGYLARELKKYGVLPFEEARDILISNINERER